MSVYVCEYKGVSLSVCRCRVCCAWLCVCVCVRECIKACLSVSLQVSCVLRAAVCE